MQLISARFAMRMQRMVSISVLLGCASSNSHGSPSDAGSTCGHAPSVTSFDAGSTTACAGAAGVALCSHQGPNDVLNEECITDDLTTCPDADCIFEGGPYTCTDLCAANEYAVSCGPLTAPPSGCHLFDGGMILMVLHQVGWVHRVTREAREG